MLVNVQSCIQAVPSALENRDFLFSDFFKGPDFLLSRYFWSSIGRSVKSWRYFRGAVIFGILRDVCIYSCFDKGCPTKVWKRTRQCRLVLWVEEFSFAWLRVKAIQQQGTRKNEYMCLCCFLSPRWNTLRFNQATVRPPLPIITFDFVA